MTDKKLTDEEIIKALECCTKAKTMGDCIELNCPFRNDWDLCLSSEIQKMALDLINRQKAEIERLKECPKCVYEYDGEVMEYCVQGPCSNFKSVEQIKAEAYKEFASRLKDAFPECNRDCKCPAIYFDDYCYIMDECCEEMVGE